MLVSDQDVMSTARAMECGDHESFLNALRGGIAAGGGVSLPGFCRAPSVVHSWGEGLQRPWHWPGILSVCLHRD